MNPNEQRRVREQVREKFGPFIQNKINSSYQGNKPELERPLPPPKESPHRPPARELLREAGALGMFAFAAPKELGGSGADFFDFGLALEEIAYLSDDFALPELVSMAHATSLTLRQHGSPAVVERYALPILRGTCVCSYAVTERCDALHFETTAEETPDGWRVYGFKPVVSFAQCSDAFLVYAREESSNDVVVLLVDLQDAGVSVTPVHGAGQHTIGMGSLTLADVLVPKERVLVASDGLSHANAFFSPRRVKLCCIAVGAMQHSLERATELLAKKIRQGRPVTDYANVQAWLGKSWAAIETARAITYRALERYRPDAAALGYRPLNPHWDAGASMAKYVVGELSMQFSNAMLRVLGTEGYFWGYGFENIFRDYAAMMSASTSQDLLEIDLGNRAVNAVERKRPLGLFE